MGKLKLSEGLIWLRRMDASVSTGTQTSASYLKPVRSIRSSQRARTAHAVQYRGGWRKRLERSWAEDQHCASLVMARKPLCSIYPITGSDTDPDPRAKRNVEARARTAIRAYPHLVVGLAQLRAVVNRHQMPVRVFLRNQQFWNQSSLAQREKTHTPMPMAAPSASAL